MIENLKTIELDLKDKKILFELSLNARASLSEIAKKVGLSKQVVKYRIENLEKKKIIEGYYAILNINHLGYLYHRTLFKFKDVDPEKEEEIIKFCKNHEKIGWISQLDGEWDLALVVWAKNTIEFEHVLDEILSEFGGYFEKYSLAVSTTIYHLRQKYLLSHRDIKEFVLGGYDNQEIDDLDRKIIGILSKNARATLLEIGDNLKVNYKVVDYRIKKLIEKKIILGYNIKINHKLLGYSHHKIFLNLTNISIENLNKLINYFKSLTSSVYITRAIGSSDIEFEVIVKTNEEFHELLRDLRFRFSEIIRNYYSFIIYNEPYINYLPMEK